ncbi:hypothetical protein R3P38DRAFT_3203893 [Favolaschia claudopus]|uniref:Uncharacterized protein n=1 Tax=Favolaschia claudopus TaxID=2862362 RepID=A0AAW0ARR7_9AGAR
MALQFILEDSVADNRHLSDYTQRLGLPARLILPSASSTSYSRPVGSFSATESYGSTAWYRPPSPRPSLRTGSNTTYNSFWESFSASKPPAQPPISYNSHYLSSEFSSLASPIRYADNIDESLMQPPPRADPLFSSPHTQ